jgi:hypothetical protein
VSGLRLLVESLDRNGDALYRFSASCCEKLLPTALELYLHDAPPLCVWIGRAA